MPELFVEDFTPGEVYDLGSRTVRCSGTVRIRGEVENQNGVVVVSMVSRGLFARRP
jgi:acyl dehydratase